MPATSFDLPSLLSAEHIVSFLIFMVLYGLFLLLLKGKRFGLALLLLVGVAALMALNALELVPNLYFISYGYYDGSFLGLCGAALILAYRKEKKPPLP